MPDTDNPDSLVLPVNAYKDLHLLKFLCADLVFDAPGTHVFCSERNTERGSVLTFVQSKSGYNIFSIEGFSQVLGRLSLEGTWWIKFLKKEYATPEEMFRAFAIAKVTGYVPASAAEEDEYLIDLLLLPPLDRLAKARTKDPEKLLYSVVKIMHSFLDRASYASYKPRYREKLLALESKFVPNRRNVATMDLDFQDPETSLYLLLSQFT